MNNSDSNGTQQDNFKIYLYQFVLQNWSIQYILIVISVCSLKVPIKLHHFRDDFVEKLMARQEMQQ